MSELTRDLSASERREIECLARLVARDHGLLEPVSIDEMALALLLAHLILIRDCGDILPGKGRSAAPAGPRRIRGKGGVSLGGGIHASM